MALKRALFGNVGGEGEDTMVDGTHNEGNEVTECYPDPPLAYQDGYTFLSLFNSDENSVYHKNNLYYPFSCREDWQLAAWLLCSGLSMGKIDSFLSLKMVSVQTPYSLPSLDCRTF